MAVFKVKEKVNLRDVPGTNGKYQAGDDGSVWRKGSQLDASKGLYVTLSVDGRTEQVRVAYVIARTFVPNTEMRPFVRHKDGNPRNNRAENLEWSEKKEELRGRRAIVVPVTVWRESDGLLVGSFPSVQEAARILGVSVSSVRGCINGRFRQIKGFIIKA